jgi:ankyrin repeat protein
MRAALGGDGTTVDRLLTAGADANKTDANGWTALICAAAADTAIVKRLIGGGAVPSMRQRTATAITRAKATGHTVVAETLKLKCGSVLSSVS